MDSELMFFLVINLLINFMPIFIIFIFITIIRNVVKNSKMKNIEGISKENIPDLVTLIKKAKNNNMNKEDILQEEIHAHDFTAVNLDDISQQEIHEHQPWNDEGPIKYN